MPHSRRAAGGAGLALVVLLGLSFPLAGAEPPKGAPAAPEKVTSVEGITEYRLANGLRVLLFPDPSKPTITVNVTYLVGSRHEGYGESGMAHLLEHLVFKGTPKHPNIPQELTAHGARPNGSTWFDRTNYFETFDATDANLEWALDLEADRMVNSFIAKKDLDSEMTVVRNEFEAGENDPGGILIERIFSTRLSLARVRPGHDRGAIGPRERADREAAGVLPDVLPAGQRRPRRRRQDRRGPDARARAEALRRDPEARADALPDLHARPRAGRRAHGHAPPRRRRPGRGRRVPHPRRQRSGRARPRPSRLRARGHAVRAPPQGARRDEEGLQRVRLFPAGQGARASPLRRRGAAGPVPRRGEGRPPEDRRGRRRASAHEGGSRARREPSFSSRSIWPSTTLPRSGSGSRTGSRKATGACSSSIATG